jgi:hypothetical protein
VPEQGDWGTLNLETDGRFNGVYAMFVTVPEGSPVEGFWWLNRTISGTCTSRATHGGGCRWSIVFPLNLVLGLEHIPQTKIVAEWLDKRRPTCHL